MELIEGTPKGASLVDPIRTLKMVPHVSPVNLAEAGYIVCRKLGRAAARASIDFLLGSGYLVVEDDLSVHMAASEIKCARSLSLGDCYTFAVARLTGSPALFATHEKELVEEMRKRPFEERILFLD